MFNFLSNITWSKSVINIYITIGLQCLIHFISSLQLVFHWISQQIFCCLNKRKKLFKWLPSTGKHLNTMMNFIIVSTCFPFNRRIHIISKLVHVRFALLSLLIFFFIICHFSMTPLKSPGNLISRFHSREYHQIKRREQKKIQQKCHRNVNYSWYLKNSFQENNSIRLLYASWTIKKKFITEFYLIFYVSVDNDLKWCECEWEKKKKCHRRVTCKLQTVLG